LVKPSEELVGTGWTRMDCALGPIGRPPAEATQVVRIEECGRKHWTIWSAMRRRCHVCLARGVNRKVSVKSQRCDVALCWIENAV
jgi:hypothetical protein